MGFKYLAALLGVTIFPQVKLDEEGITGDGISFATLGTGEQAVLAYYEVKFGPGTGMLASRQHLLIGST